MSESSISWASATRAHSRPNSDRECYGPRHLGARSNSDVVNIEFMVCSRDRQEPPARSTCHRGSTNAQPPITEPDQIQTAIEAAQGENLALVIELPHGRLVVPNAKYLKNVGNQNYAMGDAATFDLRRVRHIRAVERDEIEKTLAEFQARQ